jgi:hypothetical protein
MMEPSGQTKPDLEIQPPSKKAKLDDSGPLAGETKTSHDPLPNELLLRIVAHLQRTRQYRSLAELARANMACYDLAIPKLYETIILTDYSQSKLRYGHGEYAEEFDTELRVSTNGVSGTSEEPDETDRECDGRRCKCKGWARDNRVDLENEKYHGALGHSQSDGTVVKETRKDVAVKHCRRLIVDAALCGGCFFDSPYTVAGNYLERYTNVQEIVITSNTISRTRIPLRKLNGDRWDRLLDTIFLFDFQARGDQCTNQRRVVLHLANDGSNGDALSKTMAGSFARAITAPTDTPYYCDFLSVDLDGCDMFDQLDELPPKDSWKGRRAGLLLKAPPAWSRKLVARCMASWLVTVYCQTLGDEDYHHEHSDSPNTMVPRLALYDLPRLLLRPEDIPVDAMEAERMCLDLLRTNLHAYLGTFVGGLDAVSRPLSVDAVIAHIKLVDLGDRCEQYPWWTPDPVSQQPHFTFRTSFADRPATRLVCEVDSRKRRWGGS